MTQLELAKKGVVTEAVRTVAREESVPEDTVRARVADGTIAIPCNLKRKATKVRGIGAREEGGL